MRPAPETGRREPVFRVGIGEHGPLIKNPCILSSKRLLKNLILAEKVTLIKTLFEAGKSDRK